MRIGVKDLINANWDCIEKGNKVLVCRKKIGRGWYNAKDFLFPKEIKLDEKIAECIGLYLGDGKLTSKDLMHSDFTNKDIDLIKKMLVFFEYLGAKISDITFTIDYSTGDPREIENEISKHIGEQRFRIVKTDRNRYPSVHIQVNGTIFRIILERIIMNSLSGIRSRSSLRRAFIRGYFAAEGYIGYSRKENYIVCVGFAYNPKDEIWLRDFCIECLKLEGINSMIRIRQEKSNGQIILTNWKNYYKLWKIGLFDGCKRKKDKFMNIFKNSKICCEIKQNLRLELFSGDQYELSKYLETYQATISNMKTGSKRNMWPTVNQTRKLCKLKKISLEEAKRNVTRIRIGNLTIFEADEEMINDVFNLRNSYS